MTTKQRIQAESAYENSHLVAQDLIQRLSELLMDMPAPDAEVKIHWGHVGTINEVNARLSSVISFLNGTEK